MKKWLAGLLVLMSPSAFAQSTSAPELQFDSVPNFIKLPPDMHFGEASGVSMNSKGHLYVYSRGGSSVGPAYGNTASQILEFDHDGNFLREVGKNLYSWAFAHMIRVDKDDNIWAVDKGSDMIVKMSPEGRVLMVFGRKSEASDEDSHPLHHPNPPLPAVDGRFRQPTDVAWDRAGNAFISDGYINSRVAKVSKDGDWVKSWGSKGKGDGQFDTVHTIASDNNDNIYVGDRNNRRVQVFDADGNFKYKFSIDIPAPPDARPAIGNMPNLANWPREGGTQTPGAPWTICITPGPNQVAFIADAFPGRVYKVALDGKGTVLGWLGKSGKQLKQFGWVHQIACPSENEIYVAEILNWRVQKLLIRTDQRAGR
jgi:hypothetical protein